VDFVAGYEDGIPETVRAAIKLLVAHLFENRDPYVVGATVSEVPFTLRALLDPYVVHVEEI